MSLGVMLTLQHRGVRLLFARLGLVIGDEQALKFCFGFKGASGLKCCCLCSNVTLRNLQVADHDTAHAWMIPHTETDVSKMVFATSESILRNVAELQSSVTRLSKQAFEKVEMALGLNFTPQGPLSSPIFLGHLSETVVDAISFDWMHVLLVKGLWNSELGLLMGVLKSLAGIRPQECHDFLAKFQWPKSVESRSMTGRKIFLKYSEGGVQCSASEGLSVYGVIRVMLIEMVGDHANPVVQGAVASYIALAGVLDLLQKNRVKQDVLPATLQSAITNDLQLRVGVHGPENLPPKGHFLNHIPYTLQRNPVLACWVHERKHREVKRYANKFTNANQSLAFETGVLKSVVLSQMHSLEGLNVERGLELVSPAPASDSVAEHIHRALGLRGSEVIASMEAFVNPCVKLCAKDVVQTKDEIGEVWFHASAAGRILTCLSPWTPLGNNKFRKADSPKFVNTCEIAKALVFREDGCGVVTVVP